jgi:thioredoxin 1
MLSHARRRNGGTMNRRNFAALLLAAIAAPLAAGHARAMQFMEYRADSFVKLLATGNPLVVHVQVMDRVLAGPAYKNVHAVRVNFDREKRFLADYKVVRQSTIIVFRGGKEIARLTYDADPQRIEQTLARAIS